MSCTLNRLRIKGNAIGFDATCNAEGEQEPVKGLWTRLSGTSFRIGPRIFNKCS